MSPERVREIADDPATPSFIFGSSALARWTQQHRNSATGVCFQDSSFYVVIHPSLNLAQRPSFRVLSRWWSGRVFPHSWDIDDTLEIPPAPDGDADIEDRLVEAVQ
jgi:hypothetical protein